MLPVKSSRVAALALCSTALSLAMPAEVAFAECVVEGAPMANAAEPMSGQTINCENNLDNDGVVNRAANNVTVNIVAPAGGISVTAQPGVALGDGATVDVAAGSNRPINTSGDNAPGISVGNGAAITVGGQVTTAGGTSAAIETGDMSTVTVSGTVRTGGGMSDAINVGAMSTVTLMDGARVATGNSNSNAVTLAGDGSTLEVMQGALVTTSSGMSNPVLVEGNNGTVNVLGDVRSSSGNSTAILATGDNATITVGETGFVTAQSSNSNAIESQGTGANIRVERGGEVVISSGNSVGIVSGAMGTVEIAGEVQASSSQSQGVVLGDMAELTIEEMGIISTSSSGSQAVLVDMGASTANITVNEGGEIDAVGAQAILDEGMTDTTVQVDGRVFGGASAPTMELGAGDDTVTIGTTGVVEASSADPALTFGEGADTLSIMGTLTGSGVLADLGAGMMDTLNLNNGGMFMSSQFRGAETVNTGAQSGAGGGMGGMGGGMAMPTTYSVNDAQPNQTVNTGAGSTTNVQEGGSVGTLNTNAGGTSNVNQGGMAGTTNTREGGTTNVNEGGMAGTANTEAGGTTNINQGGAAETTNSRGGTTNVNEGGTVGNANSEAGGTTNVNRGGSVTNANSGAGGTTNINEGGRAANTRAGEGGTTNVNAGGDGGRVQADAGGSVNVRSGGTASVDQASGNGGRLTFESGSNANVTGMMTARNQSFQVRGADFQEGSRVTPGGSRFFEGSAAGDTFNINVRANAFSDDLVRTGETNRNTIAAARGLDALVAGQADGQALDQVGAALLGESEETFAATLRSASRQGPVQSAAGAYFAAQGFNDMLRAGANPLSGGAIVTDRRGDTRIVTGGGYRTDARGNRIGDSRFGDDRLDNDRSGGRFGDRRGGVAYDDRFDGPDGGVWVSAGYADTQIRNPFLDDVDLESMSYAAGMEGRFSTGLFDEGALGVAVGYSYTDVNSPTLVDGDVEAVSLGLYGGGTYGAVRSDVAVSYTHAEIDTVESFTAIPTDVTDSDADLFTGRLELSVDVLGDANSGFNIAPIARISGTVGEFDGIGDRGPVGTRLDSSSFEQGVAGVGLRMGVFGNDGDRFGGGSAVKVSVEGAYERVFGDRDIGYSAGIAGTPEVFDVIQTVSDKDRLHLGGIAGVSISDTVDVGLRYDGRFGSDVEDHRGSVRLLARF